MREQGTLRTPDRAMRYLSALTGKPNPFRGSGFNKNLLPDPVNYYTENLGKLRGRGRWRTALCVFHAEKNASLAVNVENGAFICHACGARGGDVIDFHRQRYGMGFKEAAQALGAWEGR